MEWVFVTGGTGFIGACVLERLVRHHKVGVFLLIRAPNKRSAIEKLWRALEAHLDEEGFEEVLSRVVFVQGDLSEPRLGMSPKAREEIIERVNSILHIGATLNRRSERSCLNTNLKGTFSVILLAREIVEQGKKLRRFSEVSTVAVAGERKGEIVHEDKAIDWNRRDYDPYARTKKFGEHMVEELLQDLSYLIFRPSIVMGDSRKAKTTQFDMVKAFSILADLPILPLDGRTRLDIVPVDFVARAIADLHLRDKVDHHVYHLSAGVASKTAEEIADAMLDAFPERKRPIFVPWLSSPFEASMRALANLPKSSLSRVGALFSVFWPYIVFDTVFDNQRVVQALGEAPVPFTAYCAELYRWAKKVNFRYPHTDLPSRFEGLAKGEGIRWV